ncbi:CapA family protein [Aureibaculum luteum]|uniref:CapA family protein n=1 Tax=Aureibaculum luteum TaxID=1548456 RepID=UPI000E4DCA71|nr:CapA family protein [Aureibaculum luteum]
MSILIAGDLAPIRRYEKLFSQVDMHFLDEKITKEILNSELFIVNLEAPLSDNVSKTKSAIPSLVASPNVINGLRELGIDICCLGNNHIMDAGSKGLNSTTNILEANSIEHFGAGSNISTSDRLLIKIISGFKVGFYAISNNEFSIGTKELPGANPEDLISWYYNIPKYKKQVDYLLVFYHTGINKSLYPSPNMQRKSRLLIDLGADLVTCQHSHVTGTYENYNGGEIVYGQGDFIFDYGVDIDDFRKYGSFLKVEFKNKLELKRIYFKKDGFKLELLTGNEKNEIEKKIEIESKKITNPEFLDKWYEEYVMSQKKNYINNIISFGNLYFLKILNRLNITKNIFNGSYRKTLFNLTQNDIHRDILKQILNKKSNE